jgi:NAD(P)-dependent dehydrogenase (short-subunit alcohol dehydrogenase family)
MSLSIPRRALVVGGTSGIGQGIALALAKQGNVEVTIAGRSAERGGAIVEHLSQISPAHRHKFMAVDAMDLSSVKELAEKSTGDCDLLVMTQGMATIQGYTPTDNGIDQKLQLHYFSRIYFAKLMAPRMKEGSRILTVLSAGVHGKYKNYETDFERFSVENPQLVVAHAAPGFVNTNWGAEMPWIIRTALRPMQSMFATSLEDCGETLAQAWLKLPVGYSLIDPKGKAIANGLKHSREEGDVIWKKTLQILQDVL